MKLCAACGHTAWIHTMDAHPDRYGHCHDRTEAGKCSCLHYVEGENP